MAIKSINGILLRNSIPNSHSLDLEKDSSQYASIADASQTGLDITGNLSWECWIKPESLPAASGYMALVGKDNGSTQRSWQTYIYNNAGTYELHTIISDNAGHYDDYGVPINLVAGLATHLAGTITPGNASATTFEFFQNGISKGNGTSAISNNISAIANTSAAFSIGARADGSLPYDGLIDEVRIWDDIRTATEIHDNIFNDVTGQSNLQGYWKLNNNYLDATANNNDLTASGSPVFSEDVSFPEYRALNPVPLASTTLAEDENLQGYWRLNDNALDETDNDNDLSSSGSPSYATGKFDKAIDLERGSSQYLYITDANQTGLDISGDVSFTLWVKLEALPSVNGGDEVLISKYDTGATQRSYLLYCQSAADNLTVNVSPIETGSGSIGVTKANFFDSDDVGNFVHVAVTVDISTGEVKMYKNGSPVHTGSDDAIVSVYNGTAHFAIGAKFNNGTANDFFDGLVDDVAIFNRILTAREIFDLYTGAFNIKSINGIETKDIKSINGVVL